MKKKKIIPKNWPTITMSTSSFDKFVVGNEWYTRDGGKTWTKLVCIDEHGVKYWLTQKKPLPKNTKTDVFMTPESVADFLYRGGIYIHEPV